MITSSENNEHGPKLDQFRNRLRKLPEGQLEDENGYIRVPHAIRGKTSVAVRNIMKEKEDLTPEEITLESLLKEITDLKETEKTSDEIGKKIIGDELKKAKTNLVEARRLADEAKAANRGKFLAKKAGQIKNAFGSITDQEISEREGSFALMETLSDESKTGILNLITKEIFGLKNAEDLVKFLMEPENETPASKKLLEDIASKIHAVKISAFKENLASRKNLDDAKKETFLKKYLEEIEKTEIPAKELADNLKLDQTSTITLLYYFIDKAENMPIVPETKMVKSPENGKQIMTITGTTPPRLNPKKDLPILMSIARAKNSFHKDPFKETSLMDYLTALNKNKLSPVNGIATDFDREVKDYLGRFDVLNNAQRSISSLKNLLRDADAIIVKTMEKELQKNPKIDQSLEVTKESSTTMLEEQKNREENLKNFDPSAFEAIIKKIESGEPKDNPEIPCNQLSDKAIALLEPFRKEFKAYENAYIKIGNLEKSLPGIMTQIGGEYAVHHAILEHFSGVTGKPGNVDHQYDEYRRRNALNDKLLEMSGIKQAASDVSTESVRNRELRDIFETQGNIISDESSKFVSAMSQKLQDIQSGFLLKQITKDSPKDSPLGKISKNIDAIKESTESLKARMEKSKAETIEHIKTLLAQLKKAASVATQTYNSMNEESGKIYSKRQNIINQLAEKAHTKKYNKHSFGFHPTTEDVVSFFNEKLNGQFFKDKGTLQLVRDLEETEKNLESIHKKLEKAGTARNNLIEAKNAIDEIAKQHVREEHSY